MPRGRLPLDTPRSWNTPSEPTTGILPFDRLVEVVMGQEPYRSASARSGSSRTVPLAGSRKPSVIPVHTPVHASWLNQVEIYFSIIQRKVQCRHSCRHLEFLHISSGGGAEELGIAGHFLETDGQASRTDPGQAVHGH